MVVLKLPYLTSKSVSVLDLEDCWLQLDPSLHYIACSIEGSAMLLPMVSPLVLEGTEDLEVSIDSLVPCPCHCYHVG